MKTIKIIKQAAKTIKKSLETSLGPNGYNKIINLNNNIFITNDGVTIIKNLTSYDKNIENIMKIITEASLATDIQVGDGTTSTALIACEIYIRSTKHKITNLSLYIEGMTDTLNDSIKLLNEMTRKELKPKEILQIATYATNQELGEIIANAYQRIAYNGFVEVMETHNITTDYAVHTDYRFNARPHSYYFLDEVGYKELEQPLIIIAPILQNLEQIRLALDINRPLLIVCDDINEKLLEKLIQRKDVVAIKPLEHDQHKVNFINDLKIYTNSKLVNKNLELEDLGTAQFVKILNNEVIISPTPENKRNISEHLAKLKQALLSTTNQYQKILLTNRINKLDTATVTVLLGATTYQELITKKYKMIDGINAVKAALTNGVVSGRGVALKIIYEVLKKRKPTINNKQYKQGKKDFLFAILVIFKILEYNGSSKKQNAIDPVDVTKCILQNATSIAKLLISSDGIINNQYEKDLFD